MRALDTVHVLSESWKALTEAYDEFLAYGDVENADKMAIAMNRIGIFIEVAVSEKMRKAGKLN